MDIIVECINKNKSAFEELLDTEYYSYYYDKCADTVTCRFLNPISTQTYCLPDCSILLWDVLMFSKNMVTNEVYSCVLEVNSFRRVNLYTNCKNAIRGRFWNSIPQKYVHKYSLYAEQQCIEVNGDLILISPYNNILSNVLDNDSPIEILPLSPFNLRSVKNCWQV